ncbi:hypothetical protein GCM10020331_066530 [Ectobacillus funiculus]
MKQNVVHCSSLCSIVLSIIFKVVSFRTDSQLVERALEKKQYVKTKKIFLPLLEEAFRLVEQFDLFFSLSGFQAVKIKLQMSLRVEPSCKMSKDN